MKKPKRKQHAEKTAAAETLKPKRAWWPWAAALAGLFVVLEVYGPALSGAFVLDDRYLPFMDPNAAQTALRGWITGLRPLLYFSYWLNFQSSGVEPYAYHVTNVFLHFLGSLAIALVAARLLELSGTTGRVRAVLSTIAGAVFLLHPLQTESVAYVASRSEVLSVLFFFSAFAIFLYRRTESMTFLRSLAIVVLFAAAISTKEHTLTLAALLLLSDYYWRLGGIRRNGVLYGMLTVAGALGAFAVWGVLKSATTVGFHVPGLTPTSYFFTQCRVIWTYVRFFFLPFGQNVDPDVAVSRGLLDHGAIFGLAALIALIAAAWIYRKRWPLAAFGVFIFVLLLAPTSSFIPISDVAAERRLYLPFLGLELVCLEFLRRLKASRVVWAGAAIVAVCSVLTYQRSAVWASPVALWQDAAIKSPRKWRPRFQVAYAFSEAGRCPEAAENFEVASQLAPPGFDLLLDWGLALDCAGKWQDALVKLQQASMLERSAHVQSQIGMVYAKHSKWQEALAALDQAETIDPRFEMTYVYRGKIFQATGNNAAAVGQYRRALALNPYNSVAREALAGVSQ
ncbi:MAG: tetratricopeptide repeat protein [Acidobacteriia bacterium]|nr:tetratricopeptide repeat protein [Terriglobia bacterium]